MLAITVALCGCVRPGDIHPTVLNRYQDAINQRSPQKRLGEVGLDQLRPAADKLLPELQTQTDPNTGLERIELTLEQAVMQALANNPQIRVASFDPAVSRERMIEAAGLFDPAFFATWGYSRTDEIPSSVFQSTKNDRHDFEAGVRQITPTGGVWSLAWTLTRTEADLVPGTTFTKQYEPRMVLELSQPLLRDAWPKFNLARLRVARLDRNLTEQQFRQTVEETIAEVISTYWRLLQTRRDVEIQQRLLDVTEETLKRVILRKPMDATAVQVKQAEAAVESRKAFLVRSTKAAADTRDALARLLAGPQLNILADIEIIPATPPLDEKIDLNMEDQILAALKHNPILAQARVAIALAEVNVDVATNQTLPQLNFTASTAYQGLAEEQHEAHEKMGTADYLSYSVSLEFEYPIGNRERMAVLRRTRLEKRKAVAQMQSTADQVAQLVKSRVRQIDSSYAELLAERAAFEAARIQLRALEDVEQIRGALSPEFLQLKLNTQQQLAIAARAEIDALVSYNNAIVELARATGTVMELNRVKIASPSAPLFHKKRLIRNQLNNCWPPQVPSRRG